MVAEAVVVVCSGGTRTGSDGDVGKSDVFVNANVNDNNDCIDLDDGHGCVGHDGDGCVSRDGVRSPVVCRANKGDGIGGVA